MSYRVTLCALALAVTLSPAMPAAQTASQPTPATQKVDDSTLNTRIEARLKADRSLKTDDVKVAVDEGVVTLTGTVHSRAQRARAERLARIRGVTRVENKLEVEAVATSGENAESTKDTAAAKTKKASSDAGEAITDAWITTKVKTQFVGEDALKGSDINVDTNNHVVTLKGTVATPAGRARALAIAKATKGVTRVVDELTISSK